MLEPGQAPVEERPQSLLVEGAVVLAVNHGHRHFSKPIAGQAEDARFGDGGMGIERGLHLLAADILAAADDDVLLAVDDEKIAVLVEIADIAGAGVARWEESCVGTECVSRCGSGWCTTH